MWFIIIILLATLAYNMPTVQSICHVCIFYYWVDSRDQNKIFFFPDFIDWPRSKINLGTKMRICPKCRNQNCIFALFILLPLYTDFYLFDLLSLSLSLLSGSSQFSLSPLEVVLVVMAFSIDLMNRC